MRRWCATVITMLALLGCGDDGASSGPSPGTEGNHLVVEGKPSAVMVELIGPGITGFQGSAEFSRSDRRGDTLTVVLVGTDLEGSLGLVDLAEATSPASLAVRVVEAANDEDLPMAVEQVTARIHVGRWPPTP